MKRTTYERFDLVSLVTTKNVKWLIDLPGKMPDPKGAWSIICIFPKSYELLLQKDSALIRAPISDVRKIANYEIGKVFEELENLNERGRQGSEIINADGE